MKFIVERKPYDVMTSLIREGSTIDDVKIMEGMIWNEGAVDSFNELAERHFENPPTLEEFTDYLNGNVVEILEKLGIDSEN